MGECAAISSREMRPEMAGSSEKTASSRRNSYHLRFKVSGQSFSSPSSFSTSLCFTNLCQCCSIHHCTKKYHTMLMLFIPDYNLPPVLVGTGYHIDGRPAMSRQLKDNNVLCVASKAERGPSNSDRELMGSSVTRVDSAAPRPD